MDDQSQQHRVPPVTVDERILVSLLAEMEVGRDRVFEQVDDEVSSQNQECSTLAAQFQAGGKNLYNCRRQHESCAQGHEVLQVRAVPILLDDDGAAENIGPRRSETEQKAEQDGMHVRGR